MLRPRKQKYLKWQRMRGYFKKVARRGTELVYGDYGLKAMEGKWITDRQIEAMRLTIVRNLKKKGSFWLRVFPYMPVTSKGAGAPMGGGKGKVDHYVCPVVAGRILVELGGIDEDFAQDILRKVASKLPIKTKIVKK